MHLYKMSCWKEKYLNKWKVNDVTNLSGVSAKWYAPMRMLNLSIDDYIQLLLKYNAKGLRYYEPTKYLSFYFTREKDAKSFCAYINKAARAKNFYCN